MANPRALSPELFMAELALTHGATLIDVRTRQEVAQRAPLDGAIQLDYLTDEFDQAIAGLDPHTPCYVYCDTGKRSAMACTRLHESGFMVTCYLEGGKNALDATFQNT